MPKKRVTMTDIAHAAGVSQSTVSNILGSNKIGSFPPETVDRVRAAAAELGYSPRKQRAKRKAPDSKRILVLSTRMTNPYYPFVLQSIEQEAQKNGLYVVCADTYHSAAREESYLKMALELNFLAVIYLFPPDNLAVLEQVLQHIPIITICDTVADSKADQVVLNNFQSGRLAAGHLISLGHRRIIMLTTPLETSLSRRSRAQGVKSLIDETPSCSLQIISGEVSIDGDSSINLDYSSGYRLAQDPELKRGGATAIIAVNDMLAIGAMDALLEQGLRVPEDYSIIGFDNLLYTGLERISLTTVDPHADMLAQSAMDVLLHRLNILMPDSLVSRMRFKAECQPRLIVRRSTAKIKQ